MGEVLKKFGRYFLLDHIAQGGMAEIYRARLAAADGAGRLMVIKRIQAGYGANAEFLQMFKSEIKVTMGFNHPNIVQLYDFGEEQDQPYIAMELVDGKNLRQFMSRFNELKQTFPVELAAYIIEQAACGLHYAHSFKDKITGQPLNIVHRDISPQNILISFEGNVKVIDFGIAKAATNSESTRAGVIKGKPSYLSPEQISGEVLDGRCDIFSLGTVLWELLTGRKLFAGENDLAVLKLIESVQTHVKPPSTVNPKVPKELDYIVLKTLAKQRDKRYQNAEEMQRALHKFLYAFMPEFNPSDLAYYAKDLFKNEIVEDRKRIQKLNDKVEQLLAASAAPTIENATTYSEPTLGLATMQPTAPKKEDTTTIVEARTRGGASSGAREAVLTGKEAKVEIEAAPPNRARSSATTSRPQATSTSSYRQQSAPQQRAPKQNSSGGGLGKKAVFAAAAVLVAAFFGPDFGMPIPVLSDLVTGFVGGNSQARLVLTGNAKGLNVQVNGQTVATSLPATIKDVPVGTPFSVTISSASGVVFQQDFTLRKGEAHTLEPSLATRGMASNGTMGSPGGADLGGKGISLRLNITPCGGNVVLAINGKPVDVNNPIVSVPLDSPLELTAERNGFQPFKSEFVLDSHQMNGLREWLMDVPLQPAHFGYLTIHTTPSADANIMIDGKNCTKKTPIEAEKFPIGTYTIRLSNDILGMEKTVNVTIQEGHSVKLEERLPIKN